MHQILNLTYGLGQNTVVPHAIARSCIFSSQTFRGPNERPLLLDTVQLKTLGGSRIFQASGSQLDQGDADVFYDVMHSCFTNHKSSGMSLQVVVERSKLLKWLG